MKRIPYGCQKIDASDIKEVVKVLKSAWLTQGPGVSEFEKALAKYCGARYAVACANGTSALHLAYLAAGLKKGDEAITTPNTFAATSNMLLSTGARPVFCDIRLDTYNIDENRIEKLISKKTKAIVPVDFAGQPCRMEKIREIARRHNLLLIKDASHALGARYKKYKAGGCKYSDMAIFSFHPVKSIAAGEGGAVITNSRKFYKKMISLRSHGIYKNKQGKNVMIELGYNYRLTDIHAALGKSQLKKLDKFVAKRQQVVEWYKKELESVKEIILPVELPENYSCWHLYVIRTQNPKDRNGLMEYLKKNGVGVNFHYPAVYSHPYYRQNGYRKLKLENMEVYQNSCVTLPCYVDLPQKDVKYIADLIKKYFLP